ncbi:Sas10 C-terminal domain-containing protein [Syncephalis plumigaleata]|nr:Sas10 C-terminal domain-containing protein [Syncephalis plumigaleata]
MVRQKQRKGAKKGRNNGDFDDSNASIRAIRTMNDVELDSEDEFHATRDKLMLDGQESDIESDDNQLEEVMGIDVSAEEEEDDDDDDEDEDDEIGVDIGSNAWGTRKSTFYSVDDIDDMENAKEEEEEALRLQRMQAEAMEEDDFVDEFAGSLATLSAKGARPILQQGTEDDRIMQSVSDELDRIDITSTSDKLNWPSIPDGAGPAEMTQLIRQHAPELLELLPEFEEHLTSAIDDVLPILLAARKHGIDADDSTVYAFLETKYQILMSYLNNIAFYLSLKASSLMNTQDHPVLDVLVKTRTTLEALEEIEENGMGELVDEFDAMLADMDDDNDEEDLVEMEQVKQKKSKKTKKQKAKKEKKQAELAELNQELDIEAFMRQYGSNDEDDHMDLSDSDMKQLEDDEETEFVPIPSKKVNRKRKALGDDFGDLHALGDDDAEDKRQSKRKNLRQYAVRVEQIANKRDKQVTVGGDHDLPYKDKHAAYLMRQQREDARRAAIQAMENSDNEDNNDSNSNNKNKNNNDDDDDDEATLLYKNAQARVAAKRAAKEEAKRVRLAADPNWVDSDQVEDPSGKRTINYQILKNKGLAPKRTKEQRNPRVKHRQKFVKAQKKLRSVKATVSNNSAYGGEMTGIKTGISRSVRFA